MAYQSKTYSLSDEVVAAIEAARKQGETPNQFLRRVLTIDQGTSAAPTAFSVPCRVNRDGVEQDVHALAIPCEGGYRLQFPFPAPFTLLSVEGFSVDAQLAREVESFNQRREEVQQRITQGARRTPRRKNEPTRRERI